MISKPCSQKMHDSIPGQWHCCARSSLVAKDVRIPGHIFRPGSAQPTKGQPCSVSSGIGNSTWSTHGNPTNGINLYLHSSSANPIPSPYTLVVSNPAYQEVTDVWNWKVRSTLLPLGTIGVIPWFLKDCLLNSLMDL